MAGRAPPPVLGERSPGRRRQAVGRGVPAATGRLAARAQQGSLGGHPLARRVRRPGRHRHAAGHRLRGDGRVPHAGDVQHQRRLADRADDHHLGHRRAEGPVAPEHPRGPRPLVPGLLRAPGRQRPGQPADDRHLGRRPLRGQRPEDLDLDGPPGQVGPVPAPDRPHGHRTRGQARGDHRLHRRHGDAGHRVPADPGHGRRGDVQRGLLHRRRASRSTAGWAARARAGWWPWEPSASSGSASPASSRSWAPTCGR